MILNVYRSTKCSTKQVYGLLFFFVKMHLFDYVIGTWRTYFPSLTQKCNLHQFVYHYLPNHETQNFQLVLIWTRNATWPFLGQLAFSIKNEKPDLIRLKPSLYENNWRMTQSWSIITHLTLFLTFLSSEIQR